MSRMLLPLLLVFGVLLAAACPDTEDSAEGAVASPEIATFGPVQELVARYPGGIWLTYRCLSDMKWTLSSTEGKIAFSGDPVAQELERFLVQHMHTEMNRSLAVLHLDLGGQRTAHASAEDLSGQPLAWAPAAGVLSIATWCDNYLTKDRSAATAVSRMRAAGQSLETSLRSVEQLGSDPWISPRRRQESFDVLREEMRQRIRELDSLRENENQVFQKLQRFEQRYDRELAPLRDRSIWLEGLHGTELAPIRLEDREFFVPRSAGIRPRFTLDELKEQLPSLQGEILRGLRR
jgi:hypothetical protein